MKSRSFSFLSFSTKLPRHLFHSSSYKVFFTNLRKRLRTWTLDQLVPGIHNTASIFVDKLTHEDGSSEWASLVPSNRWNRYIIWTLVGVSSFGIVWAMFARIDETVSATGKLEPLGTTLDVKAPLGGVIKNILVKDGDVVKKGQVLIELDTTAAEARLQALLSVRERTKIDLLLSKSQLGIAIDESSLSPNQRLRLSALQQEFISRISASKNGVIQAQAQLDSVLKQLDSKKKALLIREQILKDITPLVEQGAMARSQVLKEREELELLRGEVQSLSFSVDRIKSSVQEAANKLSNTRSLSLIDFSTKVEETQKQIAQLSNQISETRVTLQYQALRAPKDGVVFDLQASSPGYVVNSERPILKIVPTDNLVARVFVSNKDIGFLKLGQSAKLRIDAFPYNEFGDIDGSIKSIGSDVLEPDEAFSFYRFPVTLDLSSSSLTYKGRSLSLLSGMSLNAIIVLRQRPVISLFTQRILPFWDSLEKL